MFAESGQQFLDDSAFWSKMWAVLATGVGLSFFTTSFASTRVETAITTVYRQQYFESLLFQKTSFFDKDDNATGQLSARVRHLIDWETCS